MPQTLHAMTRTTTASWVFAIHRALAFHGIDSEKILTQHDLKLCSLEGGQQRVSQKLVNKIWRSAKEATKNEAFSLQVVDHLQDSSIDALLTSIKACKNIRQALKLLERYYRLVASLSHLHIKLTKDIEITVLSLFDDLSLENEDVDTAFGLVTKHAPTLCVNKIVPTLVTLNREQPVNCEVYEAFYGCPVEFNANHNTIFYSADILEEEIISANPSLSEVMEHYLASESLKQDEQATEDQVRSVLLQLLPLGTPKMNDLADKLNVSKRSLQRKLKAENTSFKSILIAARMELAKKYLLKNIASTQEIAYRLGFSESSNFIRFFKQNEGLTPSEYVQNKSETQFKVLQ